MTATSETILKIDGVTKTFGSVTAVDDLSLSLKRGEFFALLGPSGCGKTTLLRMLAGFETPDRGVIFLDGEDITSAPPERRPLNLMFQSYALFPHMSVRQNLNYGLQMERLPKSEIRSRVDEMLHVTHLSDFADRKPAQLSGGQRQRVALARALVKHPKVLLLDEPLGALDKKLRQHMQLELKRLQTELGITFIIVTHDQEEALVMADRMAILKDGRIRQCDTPETIYNAPAEPFVANFIGDMNFIEGTVTDNRGFAADGLILTTPALPKEVSAGTKLQMAVRPEALSLADPTAANLTGTVRDIAYHGLDRVLHVAHPASETPLQVRTTAAAGGTFKPGDAISLSVDPASSTFFKI